ncbi:conserved hypothetical protein [Mesorhizobium escarrei]|uniref:MBL fold metallo-hydrolase n=2 Tax=Mesorhizobium escarrei TaxID=666018 RepID=A0ABN8JWW3_9HYPH|nr:conserved hypothetical protein [Mesorhizobium escarrei]
MPAPQLHAPPSGVTIRMYRQGHGDCFLLAMPDDAGDPFYLLIDCGLKPGSEIKATIEDVIGDIRDATDGHIHAVLITHEHQDHTNMFLAKLGGKSMFDDITFGDVLLGWTANPDDTEAQQLRQMKLRALMRLLAARRRLAGLAAAGEDVKQTLDFVDAMLAFEGADADFLKALGPTDDSVFSAADSAAIVQGLSVAKCMDYVTGKVGKPRYFSPHETPFALNGVSGVRLYPLGPPRDDRLNEDEPAKSDAAGQARMYEKTDRGHGLGFGFSSGLDGMFVGADHGFLGEDAESHDPFAPGLKLLENGPDWSSEIAEFFGYFAPPTGEEWRRINIEWLAAAGWFADKINTELNNSSLVVAIELVNSHKVLLFPGDAQYGSWMSWAVAPFEIPAQGGAQARTVTVQDLLARTIFYKVGHHGSHNATLKGEADSDYANLDWMALGAHAKEFVAVIPANTQWAWDENDQHWEHPLKAIREDLEAKTSGRLFKSDTDFDPKPPASAVKADWQKFVANVTATDLYFEYTVLDQ